MNSFVTTCLPHKTSQGHLTNVWSYIWGKIESLVQPSLLLLYGGMTITVHHCTNPPRSALFFASSSLTLVAHSASLFACSVAQRCLLSSNLRDQLASTSSTLLQFARSRSWSFWIQDLYGNNRIEMKENFHVRFKDVERVEKSSCLCKAWFSSCATLCASSSCCCSFSWKIWSLKKCKGKMLFRQSKMYTWWKPST